MRYAATFAWIVFIGCGETKTVESGLVVRLDLGDAYDTGLITGLELVLSRDGGFSMFDTSTMQGLAVTADDVDTDGDSDAVLTWPKGFAFVQSIPLRIQFGDDYEGAVELVATAFAKGEALARGTGGGTIAPNQATRVDITLECLRDPCAPKVADAGADGADGATDAGTDGAIFEGTGTGEVVAGSGQSEGSGFTLVHEFGHTTGHAVSSGGAFELESTFVIQRE